MVGKRFKEDTHLHYFPSNYIGMIIPQHGNEGWQHRKVIRVGAAVSYVVANVVSDRDIDCYKYMGVAHIWSMGMHVHSTDIRRMVTLL